MNVLWKNQNEYSTRPKKKAQVEKLVKDSFQANKAVACGATTAIIRFASYTASEKFHRTDMFDYF